MDFNIDTSFSSNQHQAAALLGAGKKVADTAKILRISPHTIYAWMRDQRYKSYVNRVRGTVMRESLGTIVSVTNKAVRTLEKLLDSKDESVQDKAAGRIIDASFKLDAHLNISEEINSLGVSRDRIQGRIEQATESHGGGFVPFDPRGDEFGDVLPVIPPATGDDGDVPMVGYIREDTSRRGRPGRNGHAGGHSSPPGSNGRGSAPSTPGGVPGVEGG